MVVIVNVHDVVTTSYLVNYSMACTNLLPGIRSVFRLVLTKII